MVHVSESMSVCVRSLLLCVDTGTTTTSETGILLQARGWGWGWGGAQPGPTHVGEIADTTVFIPSSSRDHLRTAGVNLTTYGMVGAMTGHMTTLRGVGECVRV